jgi:flavin reductase (DIM6/NTAB) family NADH-FMN oxidoreductase RutF
MYLDFYRVDVRQPLGGSLAERQEALKTFMRKYPQAVTVLTTKIEGTYHGMTIGSLTSVSLDPPLILVAIDRSSRLYGQLQRLDFFAIHLLSSEQVWLSERFAGRVPGLADKFGGLEVEEGPGGVPIIKDCNAHLVCRLYKIYDAGDHVLVLGEVIYSAVKGDFRPLIYLDRRYWTVVYDDKG